MTVYLPKKWVDEKGLKPGAEIEIIEKDGRLVLDAPGFEKELLTKDLKLDLEGYNIYRSLIGGLYRAGYDEIKIRFDDPKVIPQLQKTIDSLYGFEVFDIDEKSCSVKCIYQEDADNLKSHAIKTVHNIKTMQSMILDDAKKGKFTSKDEIFQFRNNVLKQRDIIARSVVQQKLLDNRHFPYYMIVFNLWSIARHYFDMYDQISVRKKISAADLELMEKTNKFFSKHFTSFDKHILEEKHKAYSKLKKEILQSLEKRQNAPQIAAHCLDIMMASQACNSHILMLNS